MHTLTEQLLADFRSEGEAFGLRMLLLHAAGLSVRQEGPETSYVINLDERITHNALSRSYSFHWPGGSAAVRESARPLMPWPDAETVKAYALHRLGRETHPDEWEVLDPSMIDFTAELGPVPRRWTPPWTKRQPDTGNTPKGCCRSWKQRRGSPRPSPLTPFPKKTKPERSVCWPNS